MITTPKEIVPFNPGDKSRIYIPENLDDFNIPPLEELVDKSVMVRYPSRIHVAVLDLLQIGPASPGGGGIALSVGHYPTVCESKVLKEPKIVFGRDYYAESDHMAKVYCEAIGYNGGLNIDIHTDLTKHQGHGSSSSLMASTAVALNELFNRPVSAYNLRRLIGENYVEVSKNDKEKVCFGAGTGLSIASGFYGGISIIANGIDIADVVQPPEDYGILYFLPNLKHPKRDHPMQHEGSVAEDELEFSKQEIRIEQEYSERRCKKVLMEFLPAMRAHDFKKMGRIVQELNELFLIPDIVNIFYPDSAEKLSENLRKLGSLPGVDMCGMSSTGPIMYATGFKSDLEKIARDLPEYVNALPTSVNMYGFSKGLVIRKNGIDNHLNYKRFSEF